uniref:Reverse transcriptase domain-containing protein n=1 Tax=Astatotilapia calliptera TaxID=8154 RepID=A0AAX7UUT1_ASTCA
MEKIYSFLDSLDLPKLSPDAQSPLEQPLSIEEITNAIKLSQTGRSPGPDGFPMEFYKEFSSKLTPILESVYAESFATGNLPQTLTQATISVLLKKDKDPVQCSSYRPISLLCCDYKILTKTLALRL